MKYLFRIVVFFCLVIIICSCDNQGNNKIKPKRNGDVKKTVAGRLQKLEITMQTGKVVFTNNTFMYFREVGLCVQPAPIALGDSVIVYYSNYEYVGGPTWQLDSVVSVK